MNDPLLEEKDFNKLVSFYDKKIDKVIGYFEKNSENAKDIKQDVYLKLFSKQIYLNECINTWNWLKKVVSNHCKNYIRDNSRFKFADCSNNEKNYDIIENLVDYKTSGLAKVDIIDMQDYIYKQVCSLKPKYKEVIILFDYEDMTYEQIAKKLNCPVGTVKSRLFQARVMLKEKLGKLYS